MATVGGRAGQGGDSVPQVIYGSFVPARSGTVVAGSFWLTRCRPFFSVMVSKAHLKSHRRYLESMQPDVVTSALLQAHCSSASTIRPILKSIERNARERGRENVQREQVRPSVTIDLVSRE